MPLLLTVAAVLALATRPDCGAAAGDDARRLAAVAQQESGGDALALNINGADGGERHPNSTAQAVQMARALIAQGRSVDLGLMQINSTQLAHDGLTVETAFDACASMRAGAAHLAADFRQAWTIAHRLYNCGGPTCGVAYAEAIDHRLQAVPATTISVPAPLPAPVPPCAPSWDAWALAACTTAGGAGGASGAQPSLQETTP